MSWSERQQGLLQAMGLRLWSPPVRAGAVVAAAQAPALPVHVSVNKPVVPSLRSRVTPEPYAPAPKPKTETETETEINTAATANLDWPALRSAVAECRACGLCESRSQTVFGVGHPQAHWLVVGEAPGDEEDLSGEPFVGRSGQLLDSMLAALRLSRAEDGDAAPSRRAYIANTLKCRPPRNRNPTPAEMAQCEPFLLRQIQLLQPRVILAMGRLAVDVLLPSHDAIGKLRGRVHRYQGVPVVVTFDLVYLLRNLHEKARAWEDLCLAAEVAERAVVVTP